MVFVEGLEPLLLFTVNEIAWLVTTVLNNTDWVVVEEDVGLEPGPKLQV